MGNTIMPFFSIFIQNSTKFLARAVTQEKEKKAIQIGKEEVNVLPSHNIILYIRTPEAPPKVPK
jgi:hypothetical protein